MNESRRNGLRPVRVCLLMPDSIFAQGLLTLLTRSRYLDCIVFGPVKVGQELPASPELRQVDMFLLRYDQKEQATLVRKIREQYPRAKVVGFTIDESTMDQRSFQRAGGDALLGAQIGREELYQYLQDMWGGRLANSVQASRDPFEQLAQRYQLTPRELEILQLLAQALSTKEIAQRLFISAQTVSVHRKHILRKLGVNNTAGAVRVALEHNLHREFL